MKEIEDYRAGQPAPPPTQWGIFPYDPRNMYLPGSVLPGQVFEDEGVAEKACYVMNGQENYARNLVVRRIG